MLKQLSLLAVLFTAGFAHAQNNVGIGTNSPNANALLDVSATNKGVLVPRLNSTQMIALTGPEGLLVYNTDSAAFAYRNSTAWVFIKGNGTAGNDWSTKGNAGTNAAINFIGTTDNVDVIFKRNNARAGLLGATNTSWGIQALGPTSTGNNNTAIGGAALLSNTTGSLNTATGTFALSINDTASFNTAHGYQVLRYNKGNSNTGVGMNALLLNNTGSANTATGVGALSANIAGYSNVAIGINALSKNTIGSNLVAIGDSALFNNGTGASAEFDEATDNTAIGSKVLYSNTTGFYNTAVGFQSMQSNTTGDGNTAMGFHSLRSNTSGYNNSAFGLEALNLNNGTFNVAIGQGALRANTTGNYNTGVGTGAIGNGNSTGSNNTALGFLAGAYNQGSSNVFLGYQAGYDEEGSNKLYISNDVTDADNTLIYGEFDNKLLRTNGRMEINSDNTINNGLRVMKNYGTGKNQNIGAIYGENAVDNNYGIGVIGKGGSIGVQGYSQGTGIIGGFTGVNGISDGVNKAINTGVLGQASGSAYINTAISGEASGGEGDNYGVYGSATGAGINYGVYGSAIGGSTNYAGYFNGNVFTNGNVSIGTATAVSKLTLDGGNADAFTIINGGDTRIWNDASTGNVSFYASAGAGTDGSVFTIKSDGKTFSFNGTGGSVSSDERLKQDIVLLDNSLQKLLQLNGYSYRFKTKENDAHKEIGVIAQEVKKVLPDAVYTNDDGTYAVSYNSLVPVLINGVKEQQSQIELMKQQMKELTEKVEKLKNK